MCEKVRANTKTAQTCSIFVRKRAHSRASRRSGETPKLSRALRLAIRGWGYKDKQTRSWCSTLSTPDEAIAENSDDDEEWC